MAPSVLRGTSPARDSWQTMQLGASVSPAEQEMIGQGEDCLFEASLYLGALSLKGGGRGRQYGSVSKGDCHQQT